MRFKRNKYRIFKTGRNFVSFQSITEVLPVVYDKLLMKTFSIFRWRNFHVFFEESAEIQLVIDSYHS